MIMYATAHAVQRYQERVENIPAPDVRARLKGKAFDLAEEWGATAVILATGHKAVIEGNAVVTILPKGKKRVR